MSIKRLLFPLVLASLALPSVASAAVINNDCSFIDTVVLQKMWVTGGDGTNLLPSIPGGVQATSCYGVASGNNIASEIDGSDNLGVIDTSVLNGGFAGPNQYFNPYYLPGVIDDGSIFNPLYAAWDTTSTLVDMDDDGDADDPGWIYLGKNGNSYGTVGSLNLADYLGITVTGMNPAGSAGSWELVVTPELIVEAKNIFGDNAFDHLAFVLKASNNFVVYDFDFTIFEQISGLDNFDFTTAYSFSGSWNTRDLGGKNISNLVLWARDPVRDGTDIPEPGTLALLGAALVGLGLRRRSRKAD